MFFKFLGVSSAVLFVSTYSSADPLLVSSAPIITPVAVSTAPTVPVLISTTPLPALLTMLHPLEGQKLPPLTQVFAYGQVSPGSTLTLNGFPVAVHPKGGYLTMVPLGTGENLIHAEVHSLDGRQATLDRRVMVSSGFVMTPANPLALDKGSLTPDDPVLLAAGDTLRVSAQGSSGATAEFTISGIKINVPMAEIGAGSATARGIYQGSYIIQPNDKATAGAIEVVLKRGRDIVRQKAAGTLTIDPGEIPRVGQILDDITAVRTAPEGGYDFFLYKGMKVRLTARMDGQWRVRLSAQQSGWVKETAIQELPRGTMAAASFLNNFTVTHLSDETLVRIPLSEMLAWRADQSLNPVRFTLTLYGATDRTNLIHYDATDPLIRLIQWKQVGPDTAQIIIEPTFKRWWGYDVRYEGTTLVIGLRAPWKKDIRGMVIAIDPGHGGSDNGAMGPLGTLEKDTNLAIARVVKDTLEKAGAKPFLTRERDIDVPLLERGRIAWRAGARLFISIHGNASGVEENPLWSNGFSVYFYHPQSAGLARAVHDNYRRALNLPDHGLYYDDLSVCRTFQMPAILTEQAFLIVPAQEQLLLDPKFQRTIAASILNGIKEWLAE